jgi:hypothetical protein
LIKQFLASTSDQLCQFAEEAQLAYFVQSAQPFDKQAPEQPRQDLHGQEEAWAAGDPAVRCLSKVLSADFMRRL